MEEKTEIQGSCEKLEFTQRNVDAKIKEIKSLSKCAREEVVNQIKTDLRAWLLMTFQFTRLQERCMTVLPYLHKHILCVFMIVCAFNCKSQSTIMWQITNPSTSDTSFIVGTYHQLGNSFVDSFPVIAESLYHSEIAVFESIDSSKILTDYLNSRDDNYEYKNKLKKSDVLFLDNYAANWKVPISKLTPIELYITLQQECIKSKCGTINANDTWHHFDNYLIHLSKTKGIKTVGLETDSLQTEYINKFIGEFEWNMAKKPIHKFISYIRSSKSNIPICKTAKDYMSFSFDYQFAVKCGDEELIQRNENWFPIIVENVEARKTFIAVGLMHLYGDCGLISKLREKGYRVEPVPMRAN